MRRVWAGVAGAGRHEVRAISENHRSSFLSSFPFLIVLNVHSTEYVLFFFLRSIEQDYLWRTVATKNCVSFCHTSPQSATGIHMSPLLSLPPISLPPQPSRLSQNTGLSSLFTYPILTTYFTYGPQACSPCLHLHHCLQIG